MTLLCADKREGVCTDADLKDNVTIWAEECKETAVFILRTAQLEQKAELIIKSGNTKYVKRLKQ